MPAAPAGSLLAVTCTVSPLNSKLVQLYAMDTPPVRGLSSCFA